jgi:hypothetical protein
MDRVMFLLFFWFNDVWCLIFIIIRKRLLFYYNYFQVIYGDHLMKNECQRRGGIWQ